MQQSQLNDLIDIEKDIINHNEDDLKYLEELFNVLDKNDIKSINSALDTILHDEQLSEQKKEDYLQNMWKINDKFKCPTPQEFLTEEWIGPMAKDLYPHIKKLFLDFFDPLVNKNKLIMYCCT